MTRLREPEPETEQSNRKRHEERERVRLGFEILTFFVVIVGAVLAWDNLQLLNKNLIESKRSADAAAASADAAKDAVAQARTMNGLTAAAVEAARDSASASKTSASAAIRQADAADKSTQLAADERVERALAYEREQRPRVRVVGYDVTMRPPPNGDGFKIHAAFFNDGKRDAERFTNKSRMALSVSVPAKPDWSVVPAAEGVLEAGVRDRFSETATWVPENKAALANYNDPKGTNKLYIWLRLEYCSAGRRYWFETCQLQPKGSARNLFQSCGTGTTTQGPEEGEPCN